MVHKEKNIHAGASLKVEMRKGLFEIVYRDKTGVSVLSKTKSHVDALQRWKKFAIDMEKGKLLKPDKSAYR